MSFSHTHYYHQRISKTFQFLTPKNKSLLYYGKFSRNPIKNLSFRKCVFVDQSIKKRPEKQTEDHCHIIPSKYEEYVPEDKFDTIILNGALGEVADISQLLRHIHEASHKSTRIIVYQHNYLWQAIINLASYLGLKRRDKVQNWLSLRDLASCLEGLGFKKIRTFRQTICPVKWIFIGPILNILTDIIPVFDLLKLDQFVVVRPVPNHKWENDKEKSLTLLLTVRDEFGNIEPIVQSLPKICTNQEILFVEGHSSDGTEDEIQRIQKKYPDKNIRLIKQAGFGPGDAVRLGFQEAKNDIIILYEGDGTSTPEDIMTFYTIICSGRFDLVQGSRFIYPLDYRSMPILKRIGNIFFARWFSWFLGQHVTDVLSGIKAVSKKEYEIIKNHWGFIGMTDPFGDFEILYGAFRFGLNFCEIPMHYRPREYGQSKTKVIGHGCYLLGMAARGYYLFRTAKCKG